MTNLKEKTNEALARTALNCLEELKNRGNKSLETAIIHTATFYNEILSLQSMASALEALDAHGK